MAIEKERLKPKEQSLLEFWNMRRAGRTMPERTDIFPEDLFPWLGFLHLLEPVDGGNDFKYVIFTTRTLVGADQDMTGKRVSDWGDDRVEHALRLYGAVMRHACPVYNAEPERHEDDWVVYSRLCLPLGRNGNVTHIVAMLTEEKDKLIAPIHPTTIAF